MKIGARTASAAGLSAIALLAHSLWLGVVVEDAFISFRYARHVALGLGFVWNPGEAPVEGYTNFLWVLVHSGAIAVGLDPLPVSQGLGIAAALGTMAIVGRATWRLGVRGWRAAVGPALLCASGPFAFWAASGLETVWFAFWSMLALDAAMRVSEARSGDTGPARTLAAACLAATLSRPEGLLISLIAFAGPGFVALRRGHEAMLRTLLWAGASLAIALAAYMAWRVSTFGFWLPMTFHAKTGGSGAQAARGLAYTWDFLRMFVALPFLLLALPRLRAWARGDLEVSAERRFAVALSATTCLAYTAYVVAVGGDYMAMSRFFVPILAPLVLLLALLFGSPTKHETGTAAGARPVALLAIALLSIAVNSTPLGTRIYGESLGSRGTIEGVERERWAAARLTTIGRFFADFAKPGDSIATGAIGAIGYYSDAIVHDLFGLTDPVIALRQTGTQGEIGAGIAGHEKRDTAHVLAKRPTYYIFSRQLTPQRAAMPAFRGEVGAIFARDYRIDSVGLVDAKNGEEGEFTFLRRRSDRPR